MPDYPSEEELEQEAPEEEEMDDEVKYAINFTTTLKKGDDSVIFDCVAGDNIKIQNVNFVPSGKSAEDVDLYGGPAFNNLDDSLQESFLKYLNERGINDDFCYFILGYSRAKEQKEYLNWLKTVKSFVDQK